jgi:hypothetical protein
MNDDEPESRFEQPLSGVKWVTPKTDGEQDEQDETEESDAE